MEKLFFILLALVSSFPSECMISSEKDDDTAIFRTVFFDSGTSFNLIEYIVDEDYEGIQLTQAAEEFRKKLNSNLVTLQKRTISIERDLNGFEFGQTNNQGTKPQDGLVPRYETKEVCIPSTVKEH